MRAEDFMDIDNARNQAVVQLAEICAAMGLSWVADDKQFTIELPNIVVSKASSVAVVELPTHRKAFDISTWGNVTATGEVLPDDFQLPDYGEILDEGVPPQGDKDAES